MPCQHVRLFLRLFKMIDHRTESVMQEILIKQESISLVSPIPTIQILIMRKVNTSLLDPIQFTSIRQVQNEGWSHNHNWVVNGLMDCAACLRFSSKWPIYLLLAASLRFLKTSQQVASGPLFSSKKSYEQIKISVLNIWHGILAFYLLALC